MKMKLKVRPGEAAPWYYGMAYPDPLMHQTICYPVPLNWLVRWTRTIWLGLRGVRPFRFDSEYMEMRSALGKAEKKIDRLETARRSNRIYIETAMQDRRRLEVAVRRAIEVTNARADDSRDPCTKDLMEVQKLLYDGLLPKMRRGR